MGVLDLILWTVFLGLACGYITRALLLEEKVSVHSRMRIAGARICHDNEISLTSLNSFLGCARYLPSSKVQ